MKYMYFIIIILTVLLFVGGPGYETHRIYQHFWDMGHIFLFAALSFSLLQLQQFRELKWSKSLFIIISLSFITGLIIELLQVLVGRDFELSDIARDVLGALIGYLIFFLKEYNFSLKRKMLMIISICVIFLTSSFNILIVLIDEYQMRENFPLLADFESPFQLSRWDAGKAKIDFSKKNVRQGLYSLQVIFLPDKYPDISLQHFPRNWSSYSNVKYSLYSEEQKPIVIEMKVYDEKHIVNGYKYNDRFNREILLQPGWNNISVSLKEIFSSPVKRKMDSTKIKNFSLFLKDTTRPVIMFLDDLKLD